MIDWWLETGRLHRIHRGVYALGHPVVSLRGRWIAALLACGDGAVLSHRSAGVARGVLEDDQVVIDVRRRTPAAVDSRACACLAGAATRLASTACPSRRWTRRSPISPPSIGVASPAPASLSALARRNRQGHIVTRSAREERFLKAIRRARLPEPELNVRIEGFEVDAVWREARVIVELDGARYHDQPGIRRADRRRDAHLTAAGWRVLRAGWHDIEDLTGTLARMFGCAPSPPPPT